MLENRPELRNDKFIAHAIVWDSQSGLLKDASDLFDKMSQLGVAQNVKTLTCFVAFV
ncbi:hypothetical protein Tco_1422646, partial [Tanacetum coccineum]